MMKYQIFYGDDILYDLRDKDLVVESPNLSLEINKVGTLTFSIYPDHPYFDKLELLKPKIVVKRNNQIIFKGRIVNNEQGIYNDINVECESFLSFLNDSIYRPSTFQGTPKELFEKIINNHNSQVSDEQKLKIGNVTVTDPNDYISRSWEDYLCSFDLLKTRLLDTLGGYVVERYETDGTYIDWLADFKNEDNLIVSSQTIEFGDNLINIIAKNDAANTYSVVIPLGTEIENEDGTKERLTIKSVNDDKDYLINETAYAKFGWKVAPISETTFDDVTLADNLKTKGLNYLNNQAIMISSSFEITALDLASINEDVDFFFIYRYIRIKSLIHNFDKLYLLKSIKIPLDHPENTEISLGETFNTLTGVQLKNDSALRENSKRIDIVEKDYEINKGKINSLGKEVDDLRYETVTNMSSLKQDSESFVMETLKEYVLSSNFESYKETIETKFTQNADAFEFNFNKLSEEFKNSNGSTQEQLQNIEKYIRFVDGTIILGEVGNKISLKIAKERISFMTGEIETAYISNNSLYILESTILSRLQIGHWETKEDKYGNLNTRWVGDE